jgi:hypothetical protein
MGIKQHGDYYGIRSAVTYGSDVSATGADSGSNVVLAKDKWHRNLAGPVWVPHV